MAAPSGPLLTRERTSISLPTLSVHVSVSPARPDASEADSQLLYINPHPYVAGLRHMNQLHEHQRSLEMDHVDQAPLRSRRVELVSPQRGKKRGIAEDNRHDTFMGPMSRHESIVDLNPSTRPEPTSLSWGVPSRFVREVQALRKHRHMMSYHWLRFREQLRYIKEERKDVVKAIDVLQKELEMNPPGAATFNVEYTKALTANIKLRSSKMSNTEADLDDIQDTMMDQERRLRLVEEQLHSRLGAIRGSTILDDSEEMSSEPNTFGDRFGSANSGSQGRDRKGSSHKAVENTVRQEVIVESLESIPEHSSQDGVVNQQSEIFLMNASFFDTSPFEVRERDVAIPPKTLLEISTTNTDMKHLGTQFDGDRESQDKDSLLQASKDQEDKRVMDVRPILERASNIEHEVESHAISNGIPEMSPSKDSMLNRMLHVFKRSWLEFLRFLYQIEMDEKALPLQGLDYFKLDQLFRQISHNSMSSPLPAKSKSNLEEATPTKRQIIKHQPPYSSRDDSTTSLIDEKLHLPEPVIKIQSSSHRTFILSSPNSILRGTSESGANKLSPGKAVCLPDDSVLSNLSLRRFSTT